MNCTVQPLIIHLCEIICVAVPVTMGIIEFGRALAKF